MVRRSQYIPDDLADRALRLYTHIGVDVVTCRDGKGNAAVIEVPYDLETGQMCSYKISKNAMDVRVRGLDRRTRTCTISGKEKRELRTLFREIDKAKISRNEPIDGPHRLRICT